MMEELLGVATPDKDASWLVLTALGYIISMVIAVLTVLVLVKKNSAKYATVREHDQLRKELKAVERDVRAGDEKILSAIDKSTAMMQERLEGRHHARKAGQLFYRCSAKPGEYLGQAQPARGASGEGGSAG